MQGNYEKALEHARKAYEKDKTTFSAALDALYLLLRNAVNTVQDFNQLYNEAVNSPSLPSYNDGRSRLLLAKGIQEYLLGNSQDAARAFLEAVRYDRDAVRRDLIQVKLGGKVLLRLHGHIICTSN